MKGTTFIIWGGRGVEQNLFCSDSSQAMLNYSSGKGSLEARRREVAYWDIRQGHKVRTWAEIFVWWAAL